eukprot:4449224-Prymnesium_polylepis.1
MAHERVQGVLCLHGCHIVCANAHDLLAQHVFCARGRKRLQRLVRALGRLCQRTFFAAHGLQQPAVMWI